MDNVDKPLSGIFLQIVLEENPVLDELSVEYVPQIGFLTALNKRLCDLAPPDFSFAFSQVWHVVAVLGKPCLRGMWCYFLRSISHGL